MTPEYLGTTIFHSLADNFRRTYHLWGYVELGGELTAFHYNVSMDFFSASGVLKRLDCAESNLLITLWQAAEKYATQANFSDDDFDVIEDFTSSKLMLFPSTTTRRQ